MAQGVEGVEASGVVGQSDQVGQTNIGLVVSDKEECVGAMVCIAPSGQCCVFQGNTEEIGLGGDGIRCPESC